MPTPAMAACPLRMWGYQYNKLGMLTGFGTSSSYYLDATDYDATGQDEGTPVGAYGDQLVQYAYDQATSRLISGVTDVQTPEAPRTPPATPTTRPMTSPASRTPRTSAPPAPTTDLQCFAYNDMQELTTAWTDNGTQDPAPTSPNPGGIGGCTNPTPAASTMGGLALYWSTSPKSVVTPRNVSQIPFLQRSS